MMERNAKIYVAGHSGMVGSAIVRELQRQGYTNLVLRTHRELDLTRQADVEALCAAEKPEYVFLAAAKVGGIVANESALAGVRAWKMPGAGGGGYLALVCDGPEAFPEGAIPLTIRRPGM